MEIAIITTHNDLLKMVKDGHFFNFCVAFALNKGYRDAMKEKKEIAFTVGDYEVNFDQKQVCFVLIHKVYFLRIIHAYINHVVFTGFSEEEVINDLLAELEKESDTLTP